MTDYSAFDIHQLDQAYPDALADLEEFIGNPVHKRRLAEVGPEVFAAEQTRDLAFSIDNPMSLAGWAAIATVRLMEAGRAWEEDTDAAWAKVDELTAELAEARRDRDEYAADNNRAVAQLTAANRRADGLQADLDSATKANTAWANQTGVAAKVVEPQYLIWSNHHKAWWAPNSRGYRSNVNDAGRYTLADAQKEMTRGCGCCQVPEVPVLAELTTGAGNRKLRSVIAAATKAAIEAGQVNRYYAPAAEAVAR